MFPTWGEERQSLASELTTYIWMKWGAIFGANHQSKLQRTFEIMWLTRWLIGSSVTFIERSLYHQTSRLSLSVKSSWNTQINRFQVRMLWWELVALSVFFQASDQHVVMLIPLQFHSKSTVSSSALLSLSSGSFAAHHSPKIIDFPPIWTLIDESWVCSVNWRGLSSHPWGAPALST